MLIGSAGDSGGLNLGRDIQLAKSYFQEHGGIRAVMVYEGLAGSASHCLDEIDRFFAECTRDDLQAQIYYRGHADRYGDWCFSGGGRISFEEIEQLAVEHHQLWLVLYCDCVNSSCWAVKAQGKHAFSVETAAPYLTRDVRDSISRDRNFELAKFRVSAQGRAAREDRKAQRKIIDKRPF